ncbi:hypothetical protein B0T24DRAFT_639610 [Lasiosphaeria ovina]|uniref:Uncharacterized protein n=1 Tax=Lasiosphaeria ovina TaxID=92902 RepID=A0AAE0JVR0_9PEZI|nr:hypothetical protein B0T24DRAFT_639610 [Lasiosphaeria ovina]
MSLWALSISLTRKLSKARLVSHSLASALRATLPCASDPTRLSFSSVCRIRARPSAGVKAATYASSSSSSSSRSKGSKRAPSAQLSSSCLRFVCSSLVTSSNARWYLSSCLRSASMPSWLSAPSCSGLSCSSCWSSGATWVLGTCRRAVSGSSPFSSFSWVSSSPTAASGAEV